MSLNENEIKILEILKNDPFISQKEIAEQLGLSRPSIANLISTLQDKGHILGKPYVLRTDEYLTCVGGSSLDLTLKLQQDFLLETSNPVTTEISVGGVVRNIAKNLSQLNHKVSLMTVVGDDASGEEIINQSRKIMEVFATDKLKGETTGTYYAVINQKGHMEVGLANMNINDHMNRSWVLEHKRHLSLSSWIVCDMNVSKDAIEALIEFKREENKKLAIVGVSGPKMKNCPDDLNGVDLMIVNQDESERYFKTKTNDLEKLCQLWLDKGVQKAVVTAGINGSVFGEGKLIKKREAIIVPPEKIVDVTGAGDSFSAALISALIHKESFEKAMLHAAITASLTIQSPLTAHPKLSKQYLKKESKKYENESSVF